MSSNYDDLTEKLTGNKYTGIRIYYVDQEFMYQSQLYRFTRAYPDNEKRGTSTVYIKNKMRKVGMQLGAAFYSITTDRGPDVAAACKTGEFGIWNPCINHIISRALKEAWDGSNMKSDIKESINVSKQMYNVFKWLFTK